MTYAELEAAVAPYFDDRNDLLHVARMRADFAAMMATTKLRAIQAQILEAAETHNAIVRDEMRRRKAILTMAYHTR
jgi:hypothetical protein